jgi:integrase
LTAQDNWGRRRPHGEFVYASKTKTGKKQITVVVRGKPVTVILHPPEPPRNAWYAYWAGLGNAKSTGQCDLAEAIKVAEDMLRNGGHRASLEDAVLTDDEFEEIQRVHFSRKRDPAARKRAEKSLISCLNAIAAFRKITGLSPITLARADDCAAFQRKALTMPKNWRHDYPKGRKEVELISPNTVLKWSRSLQAAFERANLNAGRRCVRGVVDERKLLTQNPWRQFQWIEGVEHALRQFDGDELLSFLDYLEAGWPEVTVGPLMAKVLLWSWSRRSEVAGLKWDDLRLAGSERHFQIVGKWGVEKWFRIPESLYAELLKMKGSSPYVFAPYNGQVRTFHVARQQRQAAELVRKDFNPDNLGDWFYRRVTDWSASQAAGHATVHVFRKTSLQYARVGEDVNRQVAKDARLSESVMMANYVRETDEEMRQRSNRTYRRLLASLSPAVRRRYGYEPSPTEELEEQLQAAHAAKDWRLVAELAAKLESHRKKG